MTDVPVELIKRVESAVGHLTHLSQGLAVPLTQSETISLFYRGVSEIKNKFVPDNGHHR